MPCKWYGFDLVEGKICVCWDLIFNYHVWIFHDVNGGTGGMFLSRYLCTKRKATKPWDESRNNQSINVEDHHYHFAGH
jgi:hypothetical protein